MRIIIFCIMLLGLLPNTSIVSAKPYSESTYTYKNYKDVSPKEKKQIDCLTENIYHEARGEPDKGKLAVALVTLNRTYHEKYPGSICEVVKQRDKKTCQFSWYCKKNIRIYYNDVYYEIRQLATFVYLNRNKIHDITKGAIFYHANYVNPSWKSVRKTTTIGKHIFYKKYESDI